MKQREMRIPGQIGNALTGFSTNAVEASHDADGASNSRLNFDLFEGGILVPHNQKIKCERGRTNGVG
jgi:hypothetical protein